MKIYNLIIILLFFIPGTVLSKPANKGCEIHSKSYQKICRELKAFTHLELHLVPDMATRVVFPFVLDNQSHSPAYQENVTNSGIFELKREDNQNSFLLLVKTPEEGGQMPAFKGDAYISFDGFNLHFRLNVAYQIDKHMNEVLFTLSNDKREYLLEKAVKERTVALEKEITSKLSNVDDIADRRALGLVGIVAINDPENVSVKEQALLSFDGGEEVEVNIDRFKIYEQFISMVFDIESQSPRKIRLQDMRLVGYNGEQSTVVESEFRCKQMKLSEDDSTRCVITTLDRGVLKYKRLSLNLSSDRGQVELQW